MGVLMIFSNTLVAGNKELMKPKRLKTLRLNEAVIEKIYGLKGNALVSFIGRVVKKKDGSIEILVEQIEQRPLKKDVFIKPSGRYIEYMTFEEMQKLPVSGDKKASSFYGRGAPAQVK